MTPGGVHVWTIDLEAEPAVVGSMLGLLSGDERVRAARLRTTELRLRFIVAHGAVRAILGRYTGVAPGAIRLEATPAGKPLIAGGGLAFNLSHSEDIALCAVAAGGRIGVDVEHVRAVPDADVIVRRYFAPDEVREYEALPRAARTAAFFSIWTRKEAFVKAIGDGLQCPLDSFVVEIDPAAAEPRVSASAPSGEWYLRSFEAAPGYAAAVASDRPAESFERFAFDAEAADAAVREG